MKVPRCLSSLLKLMQKKKKKKLMRGWFQESLFKNMWFNKKNSLEYLNQFKNTHINHLLWKYLYVSEPLYQTTQNEIFPHSSGEYP